MNIHLNQLRNEIDAVDKQLLDLIEKRLQLVGQVGELKSIVGLSLHDAQREADMIAHHRKMATERHISPDFFEDILKRLMQESYANELGSGYSQVKTDLGKIVIVGGNGKMGRLFRKQFELSGYLVEIVEAEDEPYASHRFIDAGLVVIAVPIANTIDVITKLPKLPETCVLADLTSIKSKPLEAMLKSHSGPVVGLHPMFGPSVKTFVKQLVIQCDGRQPLAYEWLIKQFQIWGSRVEQCNAEDHDKAMGYVQALRHFITFVYGNFLMKEKASLDLLLKFSSPIYRLELGIVGRMFAQSPALYADIVLASQDNIDVINRLLNTFASEFGELSTDGRAHFIEHFQSVTQYFGSYAEVFQAETDFILE